MSEPIPTPEQDRFLRQAEVLKRWGIARSTLDRWLKQGVAPRPVQLAAGPTLFWRLSDVLRWEAERVAAPAVRTPRGRCAANADDVIS